MTTLWNVAVAPSARAARVDLDLGSGLRLHLDERRVAARSLDAHRTVALTGATLPEAVTEVVVRGDRDGRELDERFDAAPNLSFEVPGAPALVAAPESITLRVGWRFARRGVLPARTRWWNRAALANEWDARTLGLGGFTPTAYHRLEPTTGVMWTGNGRRMSGIDAFPGAVRQSRGVGRVPVRDEDLLVVSNRTVHVFDAAGRHQRTLDLVRGRVLASFDHDDDGRLAGWEEQGPGATYDVSHREGSVLVEAPGGQWASLVLDDAGRASTITLAVGPAMDIAYGADGLVSSSTGPRGQRVDVDHDGQGALTSWRHSSGKRIDLVVDESDDRMRTTLLTAGGRESTRIDDRTEDGSRRRSLRCCGAAAETVTVENSLGTTLRYPDGTVERRVSWSDESREGYDDIERTTLRTPGGRTATTIVRRRGAGGVHEEIVSSEGGRRHRSFDASTGVITETAPSGRVDTVTLEPHRRLREKRAGSREVVTEFEGDAPRRIVDGERIVTFEYNDHGRLRAVVDDGDRREVHHDATGRLTAAQLARGWLVFDYDEAGDLVSVKVPGGAVTRFERTSDGLISAVHGPEVDGVSTCVRYDYDEDRELVARTVDGGPRVVYRRDSTGRISGLEADELRIDFEIDDATGVTRAVTTDAGDSVTWEHDGPLIVRERAGGRVTGSVERIYDGGLRPTALWVDEVDLPIERDADGLISKIRPVRVERGEDDGLVRTVTVGAAVTTRTYDEAGLLATQRTVVGTSLVFQETISRDARGRVVAVEETDREGSRTRQYRYEPEGLVASARDGVDDLVLERDSNGNIVAYVRGDDRMEAVVDAADRLTELDGRTTRSGPAGELLDDGERRYRYDALGRLVGVEAEGAAVIAHVHDGLGRLIESSADGSPHLQVLWSGLVPAAVTGPDRVRRVCVATGEHAGPEAILDGDRTLRLVTDHRGSVRIVIDAATGEILQRLDYDALGRRVLDTSPGLQPFGFTGGLHDPYTGLVHLGARVLDPRTSRFLTPDPIGFEGGQTNLYTYAANDPVNRVDPTGTQSEAGGRVQVCTAPFIGSRPFSVDHVFVEGPFGSRGQGPPAESMTTSWNPDRINTEWVDERTHPTGKADHPEKRCRPVENVDEECLDRMTRPGTPAGTYGARFNDPTTGNWPPVERNVCYDKVWDALDACAGPGGWEYGDSEVSTGPVDATMKAARDWTKVPERAVEAVLDWLFND